MALAQKLNWWWDFLENEKDRTFLAILSANRQKYHVQSFWQEQVDE